MSRQPKYRFYATLLDAFQSYLSSSEVYQEYWGNSEDPSKTEEQFEKEQFQSVIDRINRVPMKWEDSEAADKGTAFNEVVDCLIQFRASEKMSIEADKERKIVTVDYNKRKFIYSLDLVREFSRYFEDAVSQVYTEAEINTKYGDVLLYGYIDELTSERIHDIKTTSKYKSGKFRNNWQHIVYPYCLNVEGNDVSDFEYNIAVLGAGTSYSTYTEFYHYIPVLAIPKLRNIVERFIEFIETNRNLITDTKIFNYEPCNTER